MDKVTTLYRTSMAMLFVGAVWLSFVRGIVATLVLLATALGLFTWAAWLQKADKKHAQQE